MTLYSNNIVEPELQIFSFVQDDQLEFLTIQACPKVEISFFQPIYFVYEDNYFLLRLYFIEASSKKSCSAAYPLKDSLTFERISCKFGP